MKGQPASDLVNQMLALNERLLAAYLAELRSENWRARRKAARGLANLGTVATKAIPALREMAEKDSDRRVREAARVALERLEPDEAAGVPRAARG
jgi:HEAT repeat protein